VGQNRVIIVGHVRLLAAQQLELANLKLEEFDLDLSGFNLDEIDQLLAEKTEGQPRRMKRLRFQSLPSPRRVICGLSG
jgi:hypothetical protein